MPITESIVEDAALEWLGGLGYSCLSSEAIPEHERPGYYEVVLLDHLEAAIRRLNPGIRHEVQEQGVVLKVTRALSGSLIGSNRAFHQFLRKGVPIEVVDQEPSAIPQAPSLLPLDALRAPSGQPSVVDLRSAAVPTRRGSLALEDAGRRR